MAGRHREFDEDTVLKQATEVFWTKGFESASTEDLLDAMEINKGSLYNAFGNKKSLFKIVVDRYASTVFECLKKDIAHSHQPMAVIRGFFREACNPKDITAHMKGCFLGNAVSELASIDSELEQQAIEKLIELEKIFEEALDKARELGHLFPENDPALTARYLINIWNGINVTRRMYPQRNELEPLLKMSLAVLPQ